MEQRLHEQEHITGSTAVISPPPANDNTIEELTYASTPIIPWPDRITRPPMTFTIKTWTAVVNFISFAFDYFTILLR